MEQKETQADTLFQELQSAFEYADAEEKKHLAARFLAWAEEQGHSLGILAPGNVIEGQPEDGKKPPQTKPANLRSKSRQDRSLKDLKNLVEGETHLRQIMENIEQVIWLNEIHSGRILYVSPGFERVWGRSSASLYADPSILIESVHQEDRVQVMAARSRNGHKPYNQAYRILRPDGSVRWIFARSFIIRNGSGEPYGQFYIAQDITDQKQVELALRRTLDRIREQFDISRRMSLARKPEAVLRTLMSAHELRSAERATLLFFDDPKIGPSSGVGLTTDWLSSQHLPPWLNESSLYEEPAFWELLDPNRAAVISDIPSNPRLTPVVRGFLLEAQIQTLVIFPLVALGLWRGCLLVYYPQEQNFDHNELRHLRVFVDQASITLHNLHLLKVEEQSRHEAERANEIKTEFLAMISHELRTPLTSIIGFTTTLLAEDVAWEPSEQRDFIQTIQQEANRLQELIDHLLDLSSLEAGMLPISLESHALDEIIKDAIPQFDILTSGHSLMMELPASLPPVIANSKRIAQVLVNLVRNASTYAPKGTEIRISAVVRKDVIQVNVSDQGPGIPPAEHKSVFQAFQRGIHVQNGLGQGAGLGLAICKGLVEAHGGRIWIRKTSPPGATISFTIPLVPSPVAASPEAGEH